MGTEDRQLVCLIGPHGSDKIEISLSDAGFVAHALDEREGSQTLAECIGQLLRDLPELQLSRSSFIEVDLLPDSDGLRGEVLRALRDSSPQFTLIAGFSGIREPVAAVNGEDHVAVLFDDGGFELEPRRDDSFLSFFQPIAEIREEENGLDVRSVGRLADGYVVFVDCMDGRDGSVIATRDPLDNPSAVATWLDRIDGDPLDYIGMVTHIFRDGGTIRNLADFDSEPETMAMTFTVELTASEFDELWSLLSR